jgi:hypothetical protein
LSVCYGKATLAPLQVTSGPIVISPADLRSPSFVRLAQQVSGGGQPVALTSATANATAALARLLGVPNPPGFPLDLDKVGPDCLPKPSRSRRSRSPTREIQSRPVPSGPISAVAGQTFTKQTVAVITDPDPNVAATDFATSINWGDGSRSIGMVVDAGGGIINVLGTHSYNAAGTPAFTVQVSKLDGELASATGTATVTGGTNNTGGPENLFSVTQANLGAGEHWLCPIEDRRRLDSPRKGSRSAKTEVISTPVPRRHRPAANASRSRGEVGFEGFGARPPIPAVG